MWGRRSVCGIDWTAAFPGLRRRETLNRPIGAGWRPVDQNWAKLGQNLANRPVGSNAELKSERQNGHFGLKRLFAFDFGIVRL